MIWNLVYNIDVAKTESNLRKYETANLDSIRANKTRDSQDASSFLEQQSFEQEQARLRRQAAHEEHENERRELLAGREDVLSRLAAGKPTDAATIAREGQKVLLKKSSARRSEEDRLRQKQAVLRGETRKKAANQGRLVSTDTDTDGEPGLIKGLKKVTIPEPEMPYDPFEGMDGNSTRDYYVLSDYYPSKWLEPIRKDTVTQAGGYDLREYYSRTLLEAFAGLGCFIDEEVPKRDASITSSSTAKASVANAAAVAATDSESVDIF
jgi:CDK-activating kinase assembly factor MAT1